MATETLGLAAFSRRVLGRDLWPHQLEAARSEAFITTIAAARRTGKTALAEAMATHVAFTNRGSKVLISRRPRTRLAG